MIFILLLIIVGELYKFVRKDSDDICYWTCIKWFEGCKMALETNSQDQFVGASEGEHSHCTSAVELELRKIKSNVRRMAKEDQVTSKKVTSLIQRLVRETSMLNPFTKQVLRRALL